jgi:hypothetical protein
VFVARKASGTRWGSLRSRLQVRMEEVQFFQQHCARSHCIQIGELNMRVAGGE